MVVIHKFNQISLPLVVYFSFVSMLLIFTMITDFNLTGYHYDLDEETMSLTIERGVLKKEINDVQAKSVQAIQLLLPINKAHYLWKLDIHLLSIFLAVLTFLFYNPHKPIKNLKLCMAFFCLFFTTFIIWNIIVRREIMEKISDVLNSL